MNSTVLQRISWNNFVYVSLVYIFAPIDRVLCGFVIKERISISRPLTNFAHGLTITFRKRKLECALGACHIKVHEFVKIVTNVYVNRRKLCHHILHGMFKRIECSPWRTDLHPDVSDGSF